MQKLNTRRTQNAKRPTGKWAYENQLLNNINIELEHCLAKLEIKAFTKRAIFNLSDKLITKDNVIRIHTHPIKEILYHLIDNSLKELESFTETKTTS